MSRVCKGQECAGDEGSQRQRGWCAWCRWCQVCGQGKQGCAGAVPAGQGDDHLGLHVGAGDDAGLQLLLRGDEVRVPCALPSLAANHLQQPADAVSKGQTLPALLGQHRHPGTSRLKKGALYDEKRCRRDASKSTNLNTGTAHSLCHHTGLLLQQPDSCVHAPTVQTQFSACSTVIAKKLA